MEQYLLVILKIKKIYSAIDKTNHLIFQMIKKHMVRADLIKYRGADENILVITLHHIASDGWSVTIFAEEFSGTILLVHRKLEEYFA
ncbi:MAG: condensation domain-containing protein [Ignavibacteria bacterium]